MISLIAGGLGMLTLPRSLPYITSPAELGNLREWLDAEAGVLNSNGTTALVGESVPSWNARVGQAAAQATTSKQGVVGMRGNGARFVRFDGVDDVMTVPHFADLYTNTMTVFIVFCADGQSHSSAFRGFLAKGEASGSAQTLSPSWVMSTMAVGSAASQLRVDTDADFNKTPQLTQGTNGQWTVACARMGNGVAKYQSNTETGGNFSLTGTEIRNTSPLLIGGSSQTSPRYTKTDIAAVLIYDRVLSDGEVSLVTDWLYKRHIKAGYIIGGAVNSGNFKNLNPSRTATNVFTNWTVSTSGASAISVDSFNQYAGTKCLRMDIDSPQNLAQVSQAVLASGKKYRLSFYAKISPATGTGHLRSYFGTSFTDYTLTISWAQYTTEVVADSTLFSLTRNNNTASKSIFIDNVVLQEIDGSGNVIATIISGATQNGDFEATGAGATPFPYWAGTANYTYTAGETGAYAARFWADATGNFNLLVSPLGSVTVGKRYRVTARVRASADGQFRFSNIAGAQNNPVTTSWTSFSLDFTALQNQIYFYPRGGAAYASGGFFDYDNVTLEELPNTYVLRDDFTTAVAAPLPASRASEPGPGTLTLVDPQGKFSISNTRMNFGPESPSSAGAPRFSWDLVKRSSGKAFLFRATQTNAGELFYCGFRRDLLSGIPDDFIGPASSEFRVSQNSGGIFAGAPFAVNTEYECAIVMKTAGCWFFYRAVGTTAWRMLWQHSTGTYDAYPVFGGNTAIGNTWNWRVVDLSAVDGRFGGSYDLAYRRYQGSVGAGQGFNQTADCTLDYTFTWTAGQNHDVIFRMANGTDYWLVRARASDGIFLINPYTSAGAGTGFSANAGVVNGGTYRVRLVMTGNVYSLYVNEVLKATYTDTTNFNLTATQGRAVATVSDLIVWPSGVNPWTTGDYALATVRVPGNLPLAVAYTQPLDAVIEVTHGALPATTANATRLRFRMVDSANYNTIQVDTDGSIAINQNGGPGGGGNMYLSAPGVISNGTVIRVTTVGTSIILHANGTKLATVTTPHQGNTVLGANGVAGSMTNLNVHPLYINFPEV